MKLRQIQIPSAWRHGIFAHARRGDGCDGIDTDTERLAFDTQRVHQAYHRHFSRRVVCIVGEAEQAGGGCSHYDTAVTLLAHVWPRRLDRQQRAHDVYIEHSLKVRNTHRIERRGAVNPCVRYQDIDATE